MRTYDAGTERQALAELLVGWVSAGSITDAQFRRLSMRVRHLAAYVGVSYRQVFDTILADADVSLDVEA